MEVVSVAHEYEYTTKSGRLIAIKPNESFLLVARTNEHWWHVRKDPDSKPFYVPAQYMKRSQLDKENAIEPSFPDGIEDNKSDKCALKEKNTLMTGRNSSGQKYRFSSFGLCVPEDNPLEQIPQIDSSSFAHKLNESSVDSDNSDFCLYAKPRSKLEGHKQSKNCGNEEVKLQLKTFKCQVETIEDDSFEFPPPPTPTLFLEDGLPKFNRESETKSGLNEAQREGIAKKKQSENQIEGKRGPPLRKKVCFEHKRAQFSHKPVI